MPTRHRCWHADAQWELRDAARPDCSVIAGAAPTTTGGQSSTSRPGGGRLSCASNFLRRFSRTPDDLLTHETILDPMSPHEDPVVPERTPLRLIARAAGCALLVVGTLVLLAASLVAALMVLGAVASCAVGYCPWNTAGPARAADALRDIHLLAAVFVGVAVGMVLLIRVTRPRLGSTA